MKIINALCYRSIFAGLFNLRTLHLTNNIITYISQNAFQDLKNLRRIDLSGNKLSIFNEEAKVSLISPFQFTPFLRKLNLANNNISSIYKDWTQLWFIKIILTNNTFTHLQVHIYYNTYLIYCNTFYLILLIFNSKNYFYRLKILVTTAS